ncbi:Sugar kinase of the NBD/HSP70 family, may contain an N-terminal HTH domain [Rhizobium sp. RU20A]|uniref:ROK family transcriptional regulator n=1 Tax=Rhizobium sp. RU20A TaxID=1907412 RepID=UPI0009555A69|nr:ROK family transcriptional regulator [Rhizobium sp. RU20A]SIR23727.1 Sugar kinase of the NBD/HSP70 family, may contain an N-terminal HTH domain [Rhizobium sp. RU20A]
MLETERAEQDQPSLGDPSRGTNQTGIKLYNERLVLSLVRAHGSLSKVEISRLTGLSTQASSVIMKQLESDGLLIKGAPQRGKVGQPSVPMSLNPEGAFSIGLKVGRRTAELVLMDLSGAVRRFISTTYRYPTPSLLLAFLEQGVNEIIDNMTRLQFSRMRGIGIAVPSEMWSWEEEVGAPHDVVEAWKWFDLKSEIEQMFALPVHSYNDATAACAAELAFGEGRKYPDFLYIFFATLIGGGVVLDGSLYPGRRGYAGSIGSAPVPSTVPGGAPQRLIQCASIFLLERMIVAEGGDPSVIWHKSDDWSHIGAVLDRWIEQTTDSLALAIGSFISVIDFHHVVIDGGFPPHVRAVVVERTREKLGRLEMQGAAPVEIVEGKIGSDARVLGAASLPLLADYARDRDVLFSSAAS